MTHSRAVAGRLFDVDVTVLHADMQQDTQCICILLHDIMHWVHASCDYISFFSLCTTSGSLAIEPAWLLPRHHIAH
jgi:hypothetical protein